MRRLRRWVVRLSLLLGALLVLPPLVVAALRDGPSVCHGTTRDGWLENAVPVGAGKVGRPYCWVCTRALRTYGHERAVAAVRLAHGALATSDPGTDWVYGESGWPWGGRFRPHRTHRNGLSFDFMVPLADAKPFPTSLGNRFGYDEEFDADGMGSAGRIDFAAIVRHLEALERQAREQGGGIARVIFAPDLQDNLARAPGGAALLGRLRFNAGPSWVRHDEHYHVDFDFACAAG